MQSTTYDAGRVSVHTDRVQIEKESTLVYHVKILTGPELGNMKWVSKRLVTVAQTPIHWRSLMEEGGQVKAVVGVSRRVILMPDGATFEEGLTRDGACYQIDAERYAAVTGLTKEGDETA